MKELIAKFRGTEYLCDEYNNVRRELTEAFVSNIMEFVKAKNGVVLCDDYPDDSVMANIVLSPENDSDDDSSRINSIEINGNGFVARGQREDFYSRNMSFENLNFLHDAIFSLLIGKEDELPDVYVATIDWHEDDEDGSKIEVFSSKDKAFEYLTKNYNELRSAGMYDEKNGWDVKNGTDFIYAEKEGLGESEWRSWRLLPKKIAR